MENENVKHSLYLSLISPSYNKKGAGTSCPRTSLNDWKPTERREQTALSSRSRVPSVCGLRIQVGGVRPDQRGRGAEKESARAFHRDHALERERVPGFEKKNPAEVEVTKYF